MVEIGTRFQQSYADSYATWEVIEPRGQDWLCRIVNNPDYNGTEQVFMTRQIENAVGTARAMEAAQRDRLDFWERQEVGATLHYHNGFGEYVRGEIVLKNGQKELKPLALVGSWTGRDLPRRQSNGEIYYPYQVSKIIKGESWRPNDGCIYENENFVPNPRFPDDPRLMDPIDISLPEMTDDELRRAAIVSQRDFAISMLNDADLTPEQAMYNALQVLTAATYTVKTTISGWGVFHGENLIHNWISSAEAHAHHRAILRGKDPIEAAREIMAQA